jgi:hypothetical protein
MKAGNLNEYGLTAGFLLLFMAIAHAIYGETVVFTDLQFMTFDRTLFTVIYVPWHQMSLVLVISAVGLIISSFNAAHKSIPAFVLLLIFSNLLILTIAIFRGSSLGNTNTLLIFQTWPQFFFFLVLTLLITLGLLKKEKSR